MPVQIYVLVELQPEGDSRPVSVYNSKQNALKVALYTYEFHKAAKHTARNYLVYELALGAEPLATYLEDCCIYNAAEDGLPF